MVVICHTCGAEWGGDGPPTLPNCHTYGAAWNGRYLRVYHNGAPMGLAVERRMYHCVYHNGAPMGLAVERETYHRYYHTATPTVLNGVGMVLRHYHTVTPTVLNGVGMVLRHYHTATPTVLHGMGGTSVSTIMAPRWGWQWREKPNSAYYTATPTVFQASAVSATVW